MANVLCFVTCMLVLCISLTLGAVNIPCNHESTDCDQGECCAPTTSAENGYTGVCQTYKAIHEECSTDGPKDGECGCFSYLHCMNYAVDGGGVVGKCSFGLPGR